MVNDKEKLKEYRKAFEKIKNSPKDRIGIVNKLFGIGIGTAAGAAAAGTVAGAAGATTILGSTTLASWFGGVIVATTPVGWVIGTAALGGSIAYGLISLAENSGKNEEKRFQTLKELKKEIERLEKEIRKSSNIDEKYSMIATMYIYLIDNGIVTKEEAEQVLKGIRNGDLDIDEVFQTIKKIFENMK